MVFSQHPGRELRACVRHVSMSQCGHFMMARAKVGPYSVRLSGTYGSDGLPMTPPEGLWEQLTPLPPALTEEFWKGDGWNSAGSEGPAMHKWANENIKQLRRPVK